MMYKILKKFKNPKKRIRVSLLLCYDTGAILIAEYFALLIRFEFRPSMIKEVFLHSLMSYSFLNLLCSISIFAFFSLYESLWRYASVTELLNTVLACVVSSVIQLV